MPALPRIRVIAIVSALTFGAVTTGCSSSDDASADGSSAPPNGDETAATAPDPCALLTVEQIDSATGWKLPEGTRPDPKLEGDRAVCNWEDLQVGGIVQVQIDQGAGKAGFDHDKAALARTEFAPPETVKIKGATHAVELADSGILTMLVGDDVVQFTVVGTELDGTEQRALAADVAEALR
ncbi:hypothetical protein BH10ACT3_BH10ACT3_08890 [soil metagenome]